MPAHPVTLTDVTFAYSRNTVLDNFSATFPNGAVTAVVGSNGSGKSTVLNLIAGVLQPLSGRVHLGGAQEVALAPQYSQISDTFPITVAEAVAMGRWRRLGLMRRPSAEDRRIVDRWITALDLDDLRRRRLGELSGGQRQRTLVAQALAQQAPVLVLDEPTTGMDVTSTGRVMTELAQVARQGCTVVMATHDVGLTRSCDNCLHLERGAVVATDHPDRIPTARLP